MFVHNTVGKLLRTHKKMLLPLPSNKFLHLVSANPLEEINLIKILCAKDLISSRANTKWWTFSGAILKVKQQIYGLDVILTFWGFEVEFM